jgi:1-acyl-sn-glycerol-3-phosphate acyltransferase
VNPTLGRLFFAAVVRPLTLVVLGLNVRRREMLPSRGPAVVVANHNSHLDTLALMSLFPLAILPRVRPVAAADYFLRNRVLAWFSTKIIGIIPIERHGHADGDIDRSREPRDPLAPVAEALGRGDIVIVFPEGSRGEPERIGEFKTGVAHLAKRCPDVPFFPVFLHGFGKALPSGEALLVPFFCDIFLGDPIRWCGDKDRFMDDLASRIAALAKEGDFSAWE